jgi:hypothetical protein
MRAQVVRLKMEHSYQLWKEEHMPKKVLNGLCIQKKENMASPWFKKQSCIPGERQEKK